VKSLVAVLPLQQGVLGVVTFAEFPPGGGNDRPITTDQDRTHQRARLAVASRFGDRLAHDLDGPLHLLPKSGPGLGHQVALRRLARRFSALRLALARSASDIGKPIVESSRSSAQKRIARSIFGTAAYCGSVGMVNSATSQRGTASAKTRTVSELFVSL